MLLIAEPKSASTSLLYTLAKILKLVAKNGQTRRQNDANCEGYKNIQVYHNTTVKRSYEFLNFYIKAENIIYKEHILPTKEHINFLIKIDRPIIILLRDASSIIKSYKRIFSVLPEIEKNINYDDLKKELELFEKTYLMYQENKNFLCVYYNEIVLDTENSIKKILQHYKYKLKDYDIKNIVLEKRNYSGYGDKDLLK